MSPAQSKRIGSLLRSAFLLALFLAATTEAIAERLPIKVYTTSEGLARDHINRVKQDSRGFVWFCTSEGLSRFDGYRFINYGREDGLLGRQVNDFLETRGGVYWVATSDGLYRFNPDPPQQASGSGQVNSSQRFTAYYPGDNSRRRYISVLYEDHAGAIWCGTEEGLYRLDQIEGQWTFSFVEILQPDEKINEGMFAQAILEDRQGALWINTKTRLYRRRPDGVVEAYAAKEGLPASRVTPGMLEITSAMIEDSKGRIWLGARTGLYQLVSDPQPSRTVVARVYAANNGLAKNEVTSLLQSSDGRLWVGAKQGLSVFQPDSNNGRRFQDYSSANGLSDAHVTALAEDRQGNLWIGTVTGGAMKLAVNGFTTYGKADGVGGDGIASIFENRAGELYVLGGEAFISRFDDRKFSTVRLTLPRGMSYWGWGWYQTMFQDHAGEWWMNTGEGLVRYPKLNSIEQLARTRPKAVYTTRDGLLGNLIFRLFEDSRGDIWIGTINRGEDGMTRWERATETFHRYSAADGVFESAPTAFCEDRSGNLWIGFYDGGLLRYAAGRFTRFTEADGLPAGLIRGLYLDHAGRLWIASADGGAARVDDPGADHPRFVTYTTADGLSSNQATCITEDQWGNIYIGTGRGVNRLDPKTGHIRQYTTVDGLANNFVHVSLRDRNGALWFGTLQALSRLVPRPEEPGPQPPILISALRVSGDTYPVSELGAAEIFGPELRAGQNQIQIDFVGLTVGESLRYQYKLEGADQDWSAPTDQRTVNFANLASGAYRFLVRAVSADGTFSQSPAAVTFKILPPIWRRWWFITLAIILAASAVYAFDRYRVARLKELDAALTESQKLTGQLTERRIELSKANRYLALEAAVTGIISESATFNEAAPRILQAVCESSRWEAGELWELDRQTRQLRCVAGWRQGKLDDDSMPHPQQKAVGDDSPGAFGFPILLGHEILGILKLFAHAKREQDAELLETMSTIGSHIGQLMDRKRSEEALRKSREERLAELERVRRRIATDLHDDIGSSLTQIAILSEVAQRNVSRGDKGDLDLLARITNVSNELVETMSDIVWAINPTKDHLSDLLQRMRRFASDVFTARNIAFRFQAPTAHGDVELGANLRREIFLVFKESVNNIVKHSECSQAEIEFQMDGDWLTLKVSDNGKGFNTELAVDAAADRTAQWRGGNGIISMRKRAAEMGGEFNIISGKGEGTTSTFRVPISR